jgi:excisionase family DNA binding protein
MQGRVEYITTAEAARRLGVSPTQIRRLVASGKLRGEMEPRPQGTRLVILWDETDDATRTPPEAAEVATERPPDTHQQEPSTRPDASHVATQDATPEVLIEELRWLRERLERAEEERSELRRMLFLEQQTVASLRALLPAPRTTDAPEEATATPPQTHQGTGDDHHHHEAGVPWWQFWRRRV